MHNLNFKKSYSLEKSADSNKVFIPGYGYQNIDIQTISDDALAEIFENDYIIKPNIPEKSSIIDQEDQTEFFKEVKKQVIERLENNRFAIISGPTGTGKTTLSRTIAYEAGLEFFEDIGDQNKSINTFLEEIKTNTKGNIPQVKTIPGNLLKAISNGGIYCINEANFLENDVIIRLANMIESGFIVWGGKKYKIHPNFYLIFTSNEGYLGAKDYNQAVKRKASGVVVFGYEESVEEELKIVKIIYKRKKEKLHSQKEISEEDLQKIVEAIFNLRKNLTLKKEEDGKKFYTEDVSFYGDFFYIRLYEKIINKLLNSTGSINLKTLIRNNVAPLNKNIGGQVISGEYIPKTENDYEVFEEIFNSTVPYTNINIIDNSKQESNENEIHFGDEFLNTFLSTSNKISEPEKNKATKKLPFNKNLYRKTLTNRLTSYGEILKRTEFIEELAMTFYHIIIDSQIEKEIKIIGFKNNKLEIEISGQKVFIKTDNEEIDLSKFSNENLDEFKRLIYGNPSIICETIIDGEFIELPNILSNPKSFEIRRRSKILEFEKGGENYICLLGMKGNIKDIRYKGEESSNYYIPQSKATEIIYTLYRKTNEVPKKGHFFVYKDGKIVIKTAKTYTKDDGIILQRVKSDYPIAKDFDKELKTRFANLDKLNLQNGGKEKKETATPTPILGVQYDIHSKTLDILGRRLEYITETTEKYIEEIIKCYISGQDVLLTGSSGTGKSSIAKEIARKLNLPYLPIQIPEDFNESQIKTKYEWNEGSVEESVQAFLSFYINGGIVELKEINMAFMNAFLNQYMDENGTINYKGQAYSRHPNFMIIATRNPLNSLRYPGTKPMNLSFLARFKEIPIEELPKDEQAEVIKYYIETYNPNLIKNLGGWENLNHLIQNCLDIVFSIKDKIKFLEESQDDNTAEELQIYYNIDISIDKLTFLFKDSKNLTDFQKMLKKLLSIDNSKKELLRVSNYSLYEKINNL